MSIAQSPVLAPLSGVSPPLVAVELDALPADAGLDVRWHAWQSRGRARDAVRRERVRSAALVAVIVAAVTGILLLELGWRQ